MLDPNVIAQLVEEELRKNVKQQVEQAVSQTEWIEDLEKQIIQFVQDRITARFSNIGTLPDLVATVESSVTRLFEQGFVPDIGRLVSDKQIQKTVDLAVEQLVEKTIDSLTVDPAWIEKIQNVINHRMSDRVAERLRGIDINKTLTEIVVANKDTIFNNRGVIDQASEHQITVMDGVVVVENELVVNDLSVERNTYLKGDVTVNGDLAIKGQINVDNKSWQILGDHIGNVTYDRFKKDFANELIDTVIDEVKEGIEIDNVTVDGHPLVSGDTLSVGVKKSGLTQVGTLNSLTVSGPAGIADTLTVKNTRVGINTENPDNALTVWDEEISVGVGKLSKNVAHIGTTRNQNLSLGVNRQSALEIDKDGMVTVQQLRISRNTLSWDSNPPGYSGTKGDIVFNTNFAADKPFAWMCLGAFRWQEIKISK